MWNKQFIFLYQLGEEFVFNNKQFRGIEENEKKGYKEKALLYTTRDRYR